MVVGPWVETLLFGTLVILGILAAVRGRRRPWLRRDFYRSIDEQFDIDQAYPRRAMLSRSTRAR